jgi:hypothetical protein
MHNPDVGYGFRARDLVAPRNDRFEASTSRKYFEEVLRGTTRRDLAAIAREVEI